MKKRLIASFMIAAMATMSLAGCSSTTTPESDATSTPSSDQTATEAPADDSTGSDTPLVVGYSAFSEKFSPFFSNSVPDSQAMGFTQITLLTSDRTGAIVMNAKDGETIAYNGTDYTYNGLSNVEVNFDEATNLTTYHIELRDDVTFSDGETVTADDVIFSMYVQADPSFDGSSTLGSKAIVGMKNYRANSTAADSITTEDVNKAIADMPAELEAQIIEQIIVPVLTSELDWVAGLYGNDSYKSYTDEYPETKDLFAHFYSKDDSYDSTQAADEAAVLADLIEMYGADYKTLGTNYGGSDTYYDADVATIAEQYVVDTKKDAGEGEEVPNIEGIKKLGEFELEVTTVGYDATMIYALGFEVAPLHYYGDEAQYDYDNNQFGFPRGDLTIVREKTTTPMGAGPYKFVSYENKIVYLEANESYYLGTPSIKYLQLKESSDADKVAGLLQGTIDITDPSGSKTTFEQIKSENSNGELNGDTLVLDAVDNRGYGYIGLNANTINVNDEPASDASKNLRKGLSTVFSVFRDVAMDTYYGDAASVIQYPISNTSWAAPQKSDADYKDAFSETVDGTPIYTESMTAEDKYEAAKAAAVGYFEAAGYTVVDGVVTAAPAGAKMQFEVLIGADGSGDHPSFSILTDTKAALAEIGITLEIRDFSDTSQLWTTLDGGEAEIWCAAWQATADPDMYQIYHSDNAQNNGGSNDNRYNIQDETLDELIMTGRTSDDQTYRKAIYKEALDVIIDWAVEIPVYQRQNCIVYSPQRIDETTMTPDITTNYNWYAEIENIKMK